MVKTYKDYLEIEVEDEFENIRQVLSNHGVSRKLFLKLLDKSRISIRGQSIRRGTMVNKGDIIRLEYLEEEDDLVAKKMDLDIIYEDVDLLIVNKKSGQVSHPIKYYRDNTLLNGLKEYFMVQNIRRSPRLVNRLDKDTEGLIIIAKNPYIDCLLSAMIKAGQIKRKYILIVEGNLAKENGRIDYPILEVDSQMERLISKQGKQALTFYRKLAGSHKLNLLEAELKTGRSHQIRVHFKALGHSIVNDPIYNRRTTKGPMRLCSYYLAFKHPVMKDQLELCLNQRLKEYENLI